VLRWTAVALVPVVLSLAAVYSFFYPVAGASELGWWGTPLGEGVSFVAIAVAVPAFPVGGGVGFGLAALGVPEGVALAVGAGIGAAFAALVWGALVATLVAWMRPPRGA